MDELEILIKDCQKKSHKAFDKLYEKFSPLIYGICLRYTKNEEDAKDLMQDNFLKILEKINDFQFNGSVEGWIRKVTINNTLNSIDKNKTYYSSSSEIDPIDEIEPEDVTDIQNLNVERIIYALNEMPDGCRTIFNLRVVEGYKLNEIAETLGINESTARTQYHYAKKLLISKLKEENYERF